MSSCLLLNYSTREILSIPSMNSVRWMKTFPTLEHDRFCYSVYTKVFNRSYLAQYAAKTFETCETNSCTQMSGYTRSGSGPRYLNVFVRSSERSSLQISN